MGARGKITLAALLAGGFLSVAGFGAHRYALAHVAYYTGDAPRATNCLSCHFDARGGTLADRILRPRYRSPLKLAHCRDEGRLLVTARDSDLLLVIDTDARRVASEIPVGRKPFGVTVDRACDRAYVTNEDSDTVSVVDLREGRILRTLPAGWAPQGVALSAEEDRIFTANWMGDDLSLVEIRPGRESRLAAGSNPTAVAISPDGGLLLAANELSRLVLHPRPPVSEVTAVDPRRGRVVARFELPNAHLLESVAFAPEGDLALVPHVRPKNLVPALQVERGWMMTTHLAVLDLEQGRVAQMPLDEPDAYFADPADVAVTPDGATVFVSHGGVDRITAVDLGALRRLVREGSDGDLARWSNHLGVSARYVRKRIPVGADPRGLAASPDGRLLYVAERLDDRIGIVDIARLERVGEIDLGGPRHVTIQRRGERLFHSAEVTLQRQFSCRSCHPQNHADRLQYDFEPDGLGRAIVDNRTLLGIRDTGPFKWNGKNTSLHMQCGIRFARFLTRSAPYPPEELNALVAFINSLEPPRNRLQTPDGRLTPAQARGKAIYERTHTRTGEPIPERNRCVACHALPRTTNLLKEDVGTTSPFDQSPWESGRSFDTPQLQGLALSAPYLHDGRAMTLEEIWTLYSPDDTHGVTSDLGKEGLNDLVEYLKTL